jgi:hypothetical protein
MTFQVKIGSTWTTPPTHAMPSSLGNDTIENPPIVRYSIPDMVSGYGLPVATSNEMYATIGKPVINRLGMLWWYTVVGLSDNVSTPIMVQLFDPVTQAWTRYSGLAWRPTYTGGKAGNKVTDFTITITNLEVTT